MGVIDTRSTPLAVCFLLSTGETKNTDSSIWFPLGVLVSQNITFAPFVDVNNKNTTPPLMGKHGN